METRGAVQPSASTRSKQQSLPLQLSSPRRMSNFWLIIFLTADQLLPANLVKILLLRAGIESNPGPNPSEEYLCNICQLVINDKRSKSVKCNNCQKWIHQSYPNCSGLKNLKSWSRNYNCQKCLSTNVPDTSQPSQPQRRQPQPARPPPPQPQPQPSQRLVSEWYQRLKADNLGIVD